MYSKLFLQPLLSSVSTSSRVNKATISTTCSQSAPLQERQNHMPSPRRYHHLVLKQQCQKSPSPEPPPPLPKETKKKMMKQRMKAFREKMKQDPEKYQKYLCKNKEKCRTYRANMTANKKAQETEKGKERVRKSRQRRKMLKQAEPPRVLMWTVSGPTQETERAEWWEEKKRQAVNMHWKTRQAKNETKTCTVRSKKQRE